MSPVTNAGVFLIKALFDLYIFVMLLRFLLQLKSANPHNPITRFIIQATRPLVMPLQKLLPCVGRVNLSVIFWLLVLEALKLLLITVVGMDKMPQPLGLVLWGFGSLLGKVINIYFFAILIQVILSWVQPSRYHPALEVLYIITGPILRPFQRVVPVLGGFDISPIFAMLTVQVLNILLAQPMIAYGTSMALTS